MSNPQTVTLKKPIKAHGEDVSVLTFRELTAADYARHGFPLTLVGDGSKQINVPAVVGLISSSAGVPPSSVEQMTGADFTECLGVVMSFFE